MLVNTPASTGKKSQILTSLELIESLVDTCHHVTVPQSVNGISLAIVSESALVYRLIMNAAFRHMQFTYIDDDINVDCEAWQEKVGQLANRMKDFTYKDAHSTRLTPNFINEAITSTPSIQELWDARRKEPKYDMETRINNYGISELDRWQEESRIADDMVQSRKQVYAVVENDVYNFIEHDIEHWTFEKDFDKHKFVKDRMEVWECIPDTAFRMLSKVRFALNQLGHSRDRRSIPDFMYEEFAHIIMNECDKRIKSLVIDLESYWSGYSGDIRKHKLSITIDEEWWKNSHKYEKELFESFINNEAMNDTEWKYQGYAIFGTNGTWLRINMTEFGRYIYSAFESGKSKKECYDMIAFLCKMVYLTQLLREKEEQIDNVHIHRTPEVAAFFNETVEKEGRIFNVNMDYFYQFLRSNLLEGKMKLNNYDWIIVLLIAKYFGFFKLKINDDGETKFVGTDFGKLLNSPEWGFNVPENRLSPFAYLVTTEIQNWNDLASCPKPDRKIKGRTATGLKSIQDKLDFCLKKIEEWRLLTVKNG